jgi:hypothetical protein
VRPEGNEDGSDVVRDGRLGDPGSRTANLAHALNR